MNQTIWVWSKWEIETDQMKNWFKNLKNRPQVDKSFITKGSWYAEKCICSSRNVHSLEKISLSIGLTA